MKTSILLFLSAMSLFLAACDSEGGSEKVHAGGYAVGDTARDFQLKNVDGKTVSLTNYDNAEGYIVVFTCNTCPYSKMYEQRIIDLHKKFAAKGFPVIAINSNDAWGDSYEDMVELADEKNYPFPYVFDETQQVAKDYGATNTPHVYVLNKDRKVVYIGAIDNNTKSAESADKFYVEDAVKAIQNNSTPKITKTKAIGCTIKWS